MLHPFATPIRRAKGCTGIMIDYAVSTTKNLTRAQSAHIRPACSGLAVCRIETAY